MTAPVQRPASNSDARKRAEHDAAEPPTLEVTLAYYLHREWCDVPNHSYGAFDYESAVDLAGVIRTHIADGGSL